MTKRALLSVYRKEGIVDLARGLAERGFEILSTGGTSAELEKAGVKVTGVSKATGFPEILDGRVKTLHPAVFGGILGRRDSAQHQAQMAAHAIGAIDLVAVNLYPFEKMSVQTIKLEDLIEYIDVGGPAMIRAAAKNYKDVAVVVDPSDYPMITQSVSDSGISPEGRLMLAKKAFARTAAYDAAISNYLYRLDTDFPPIFTVQHTGGRTLRYGENPHQKAALYGNFEDFFKKIHGKELSYNNIVDIQAAAELLAEFEEPSAVIIKHTNPCGVGTGKNIAEAYGKALATDPKSAFGGIVAVNRMLDMKAAGEIDKIGSATGRVDG